MSTFYSNCTIPSADAKFVIAPNIRGTLQILWSCLSTLILCTWTVLHLNVPVQSTPRGFWEALRRRTSRYITKTKWMLGTLLAPEFLLGKALGDLASARHHVHDFKNLAKTDMVEWSLAHTFFANMGGFVVRFDDKDEGIQGSVFESEGRPNQDPNVDAESFDQDLDTAASLLANDVPSDQPDSFLPTAGPRVTSFATEASQEGESRSMIKMTPSSNGPAVTTSTSLNSDQRLSRAGFSGLDCHEMTHDLRAHIDRSKVKDFSFNTLHQTHSSNGRPVQQAEEFTQVDLENALGRQELRLAQIKAFLERRSHSRDLGINGYASKVIADSDKLGQSYWRPDEANIILVRSSLREVRWDHFPLRREKYAFEHSYPQWYRNLVALQGNFWVLDACQLLYARQIGIIEKLPALSEDELNDRNKGDFIVKGLAVGQVTWLIVQLIARAQKDLPLTQLEILTLAVSVSAFVTYILIWSKPQDVTTPMYVAGCRRPTMEELIRLSIKGPQFLIARKPRVWIPSHSIHVDSNMLGGFVTGCGMSIGALLFGSIHLAAWNLIYPTVMERLLWKIASIITAVVPITNGITEMILEREYFKGHVMNLGGYKAWIRSLLGVPYALSRIYITVEMIRCLFFLPPEAFLSTWSSNIPHVG